MVFRVVDRQCVVKWGVNGLFRVNLPEKNLPRPEESRAGRAGQTLYRVQLLQAERTENARQLILQLSENEAKDLLLAVAEERAALILDISAKVQARASGDGGGDPGPSPGHHVIPSWCVCHHCREMPTDLERLCCGAQPNNCLSLRRVGGCLTIFVVGKTKAKNIFLPFHGVY